MILPAVIAMSNTSSIPNYRTTVFEYVDLTVIHGEPTYETLQVMLNQLKANARSVRTSLGGGNHGYLGLLLPRDQYDVIAPNTPFIQPIHPGQLEIPPFQLPHVTHQVMSTHAEQVRLYNECYHVGQALRKQIIAAIDNSYLAALKNRHTNTITVPLADIILYLFRNYGRVTPATLVDEEQKVLQWNFDPVLPIVLVFNKVDDLMDLASAAGSPYTAKQLINFAYVIINKTGKFTTGIREWNRLPENQKTWENFTTHFSNAHRELRESGELLVNETPFHTANLVQEVIDGVQQALNPTTEDEQEADEILHSANIAMDASVQQTLLLQQMMQLLQSMQQQMNINTTTPSSNTTSTSRQRTRTNKYCWSHGACAHTSAECRSKKPGHKDDATFRDMKGGCTDYVRNH